jgi:hypothetical protein
MAVKFLSVSGFICERALNEADRVVSAIRIVDVFYIPPGATEEYLVSLTVIMQLKSDVPVPTESFQLTAALVKTSGERESIQGAPPAPIAFQALGGNRSVPSGIMITMPLTVKPKNFGTCYVEFAVDGESVIRIPFTILSALPDAALPTS